MNDEDTPGAEIIDFAQAQRRPRQIFPASAELDIDEGVELEDIAWLAKRIVRRQLDGVDWMETAGLAVAVLDESDIGVLRGLLAQVKITVEIEGF